MAGRKKILRWAALGAAAVLVVLLILNIFSSHGAYQFRSTSVCTAEVAKVISNEKCIFTASIAVAYASVKVYDIPIREWLTERFIRKN